MIGVCIKYFHENYGGMLQAFATIKAFEKRGLKYELIRYKKCCSLLEKLKQFPRIFNNTLLNDKKEAFIKRIGLYTHSEFKKNDKIRLIAFNEFKENNFTELSPIFCGYKALCEGTKRYSAIVTGSDQLWSPAGLPTNFYNLMFVPDYIRKISIASSFGVKEIPWYQINRTREYLNRIEFISMRETRGTEIVKELTGRSVPTILDPVFWLSENEWLELIPLKREIKEPYIFAYFLGANSRYRTAVKKVAKQMGCKIIALRHLDQFIGADEQFGDFAPYDVSPEMFLNLLRGANYVCTDSFHGSVFSIIHHKQFVTFNRYNDSSKYSKNTRIDTLCASLGLEERRFSNPDLLCKQLVSNIDYQNVMKKLQKLKILTDEYLNKAFDGIK